jgi:hypothetical protein
MNRTTGRFLILGLLALTISLGGWSSAGADWPWDGGYYGGYPAYTYGAGYYPSTLGSFGGSYWPSSYYVGYPTWCSYYWPGSCCGGSCGGGSCCGSSCWGGSCCGTSSCYASSGCCGLGSCCGSVGCGGACGSGCGLACGSGCYGCGGCGSGCGTAGGGCGAAAPTPAGKLKPTPDGEFKPRTYDPDAPGAPAERPPRPAPTPGAGAIGPPAAGPDPDAGSGRPYARGDRPGDTPKAAPPAKSTPEFESPAPATTKPPAGAAPDKDPPFGTNEAKKPTVPIPGRGADKKAPITAPDDPALQDGVPDPKFKSELKKPSAENPGDNQPQKKGPALTLQDRSTWRLTGVSRPLFGQIAQSSAPLPERLSPSTGDWAVFSTEEAQVVRR